ncbi:hypothetical protein Dimus_036777, partial [Dionaea muscipula]
VMSCCQNHFPTRNLRMGCFGRLRERLVLPLPASYLSHHDTPSALGSENMLNLCYFFFLQWVVQGVVDVDMGANPFAKGAEEDEGVNDQVAKVVDIVDTFRLQEQPPFDKKQFMTFMKRYIKNLTPKLEPEKQEVYKKHIEAAVKYLLPKLSDLQFFVGESMHAR